MTDLPPIPIHRPQGCLEHPAHITTDALAALARSQGATHHHVFSGEDGRRWFEWWQQKPLPEGTPLWPYPTQRPDTTDDL